MDLVVVFLVICAIAWLRKGWALTALPGHAARTVSYA
jgi:hypothetical protein